MKIEEMQKTMEIMTGKFGVEIEMYNITREYAARLVASYFGTMNTVCHDGGFYDKWICRDAQGRKYTFMSDASIQDINRGCEMVTPILGYSDIEDLQELVRLLRHAGAKSDPNHQCGVHIHVDATNHTPATLRNLANLMKSHDELIMNAIGFDSQRRVWCRPVDERFVESINNKKPSTMQGVKEVWYESQGYSISEEFEHYSRSRYNILNLHSLWQNKGIEFRCFQFDNPTENRKGGLHAGQLKAYIQLCLAISEMAKRAKYARNNKHSVQSENPTNAMYRWMRRMGMHGEDFDTARVIFTRNLEGTIQRR